MQSRTLYLKTRSETAKKVVQELLDAGYVTEESFATGGHSKIYYVPLQPAVDWLRSQGMDVSKINFVGNQTGLHRLLEILISAGLQRSRAQVKHDVPIGKKIVDVLCENTAYEICTSAKVDAVRVIDALQNGVTKFIFICLSDSILESISKQLPSDDRIEFRLATVFVEKLLTNTGDYKIDNHGNHDN
jgi:hypothetical protein